MTRLGDITAAVRNVAAAAAYHHALHGTPVEVETADGWTTLAALVDPILTDLDDLNPMDLIDATAAHLSGGVRDQAERERFGDQMRDDIRRRTGVARG